MHTIFQYIFKKFLTIKNLFCETNNKIHNEIHNEINDKINNNNETNNTFTFNNTLSHVNKKTLCFEIEENNEIKDNNQKEDNNNVENDNQIKNIKIEDIKIEDVEIEDNQIIKNKKSRLIYNYNISHIDENNNWLSEINKKDFNSDLTLKYLELNYLNNSRLNLIQNKYQIISETGKITLDQSIFNRETLLCTSTTLINPNNSFQGITNLEILCKKDKILIEKINIRTKTKNNGISNSSKNAYRDILWDLEFEESDNGYIILGLDNFIHINLYKYENIYLDIIFSPDNFDWENGETFELKFDKILYDNIIRLNLEKNLYRDEEYYLVDIIDYLEEIKIDINNEQKMYGNIYNTNYDVLRIMSGMGGIAFSN